MDWNRTVIFYLEALATLKWRRWDLPPLLLTLAVARPRKIARVIPLIARPSLRNLFFNLQPRINLSPIHGMRENFTPGNTLPPRSLSLSIPIPTTPKPNWNYKGITFYAANLFLFLFFSFSLNPISPIPFSRRWNGDNVNCEINVWNFRTNLFSRNNAVRNSGWAEWKQ